MRTVRLHQWLVGAFVATAALAMAGSASAAGGGVKEQKGKNTPAPKGGGTAETGQGDEIGLSSTERDRSARAGEGGAEGAEEEKTLTATFDLVIGFGRTPVVNTGAAPPGTTGTGLESEPSIGTAKFTSYSFLFGVAYEFAKGIEAGVRLPVAAGRLSAEGLDSRGPAALGNIEIEGAYKYEINEKLALEFALGVALPTAQGTEIPEAVDAIPVVGSGIDHAAYDRFAIQKAAQASRGFEDNALFEPSHLGLIPKVVLEYHQDKLKIDPWIKLENLIATDSALAHKYIGEFLLGANVGYVAAKQLEPTLRLWTNIPVANADFKAVAVVEPQLRMHFGEVTPVIGLVLPVAGSSLTSPYVVGLRLGVGAKF